MTDTAPPAESGDTQDEPQPRQRPRTTLTGLALGLVVPFAGIPFAYALRATGSLESRGVRALFGIGWDWVVAIVVLVFVLRVEKRPLSSIGFRGVRWTYLATTPLWWLLGTVASLVVVTTVGDAFDAGPARALQSLPLAARVAIVITAPVTEELFFRGYAVERINELTGRMWIAATVATLVFAGLHIPYYGLVPGLVRIPLSALLTLRYIRSRSLVPAIALHFLIDLPLAFAGT